MDKRETLEVAKAAMRGASLGGPAGVVASLAIGGALVCTAPAWVPFVGGAVAVNTGIAGAWAAGGAAAGAVINGIRKAREVERTCREIEQFLE